MNEINTKNDIIKSFYFNGFVFANLKKSEIHSKFLQTLKKIDFNVEKNKYFQSINRNVFANSTNQSLFLDHKSTYYEFFAKNPVFLEILLANGIPNLVETVFQKKMLLWHISVRKSFKEKKLLRKIMKPWGYIGPHRDCFFKKNKWHGEVPPGCRVLFYPQHSYKDNTETKMLEVYPSTYRKMTNFRNSQFSDLLGSFIDKKLPVFQSNNQVLLMHSATRHSIAKEKNKQGSMRVIYYFADAINFQDGTHKLDENLKPKPKLDEILNEISVSVKQDSLNTIKNIKNYY